MLSFNEEIQIRWSDLDGNIHLRHSVYYDWGSYCRIKYLQKFNLTSAVLQELQVGVILFREECVFKKEIRLEDTVRMDMMLVRAKKDYSRWSIRHHIYKNGDTLAAILTVEGAWMDIIKRKLANPGPTVLEAFNEIPRDFEFEWQD